MARSAGKFSATVQSSPPHDRTVRTAIHACLLILSLQSFSSQACRAADFSRVKQVYVPPTRIVRRVDFSSMREELSSSAGSPQQKPKKGSVSTTVASPPAKNSRPAAATTGAGIVDPALSKKLEDTARSLIGSGKLEEAQRVLGQLRQITPEDRNLLTEVSRLGVKRAQTLLSQGNVHDALIATRQALLSDPASESARDLLNQIHRKSGFDPSNSAERLKKANQLFALGHYQEARVEYKEVLELGPSPEAHVGLAKIADHMRDNTTAKHHLDRALELDANSAAARRELGLWYLKQGDLVGANTELSKALLNQPKDQVAGNALIKLWQGQLSKMPDANSHLGLARAYQLTGNLSAAQAEYRQVVRLDPSHPYLPAARQSFKLALAKQEAEKSITAARTLESQGLLQEAFKRAQASVALNPSEPSYKIYQGELLEKLGLPTRARESYLSALKDDPSNRVAAERIKNLPVQAVPGIPLTQHPAGFPGSKFPLPTDGLSLAPAPPATTAAGLPVDHVGTLSNFLGSLRNHMIQQKSQSEKYEEAVKQLTAPSPPPGITEALHTAGGDDLVEKILRSPIGSPLPKDAANESIADGAAPPAPAARLDKPFDLAGSIRRLKELDLQTASVQRKAQNAKRAGASPSLRSQSTGPAKATALSTTAPPPVAPDFVQPADSALMSGTAGGVEQALPGPGLSSYKPMPAPDISGLRAHIAPPSRISPGHQSEPSGPLEPPPDELTAPGTGANPLLPAASPADPPSAALETDGLRPALPSPPEPLRFELRQIDPGLQEVRLKVLLKNDSLQVVQIPDQVQAFIRYRNNKEWPLKVVFTAKSIPSGGSVPGVVRVPLSKVDPTADLVLRNFPGVGPKKELHLLTAISER